MSKSIPLKEIVGFLPYGLKGLFNKEYKCELITLRHGYDSVDLKFEFGQKIESLNSFYPIVRPLSDLTKEITHNGETFVPIETIEKIFSGFYFAIGNENDLVIKRKNTNVYHNIMHSNEILEFMYEHHFDLFDWIKDGLAVSINDL